MKNPFAELKGSTRLIISSIVPLFVVVVLFILSANFGLTKIRDIRGEVDSAQSDKSILTQKLDILRAISPTAAQQALLVSSAVPDSNVALAVLSQLRILSSQNGVVLVNLKVSSPATDSTGLSRVDVSFEVDGTPQLISGFLNNISSFAPLTIVSKLKLTQTSGASQALVTVSSFWASFPAHIPTVTQPVTDLTAQEKTTLSKILGLTQPAINATVPTQSGAKINPFTP